MEGANRIWQLLSKKENDDLSAAETAELEQLLQQHPTIAAANAVFQHVMRQKITAQEPPMQPADSWTLIKNRMAEHEPVKVISIKRRMTQFFAAASIGFLLLAGSIYLYYQYSVNTQPGKPLASNQVSTPMGSRSKIDLPDGTKVWLNAGSSITYNDFQKAGTREVTLAGEAYFDVVHSDTQPFVVHTESADIYDLGTVFTVRAYPHDQQVETTLIEGSVAVTDHRNKKEKILLKPNEKLTLYLAEPARKKAADAQPFKITVPAKNNQGLMAETAWINNKLVFNNEGFHDLAGRMERWYNVRFHFDNSAIASTPFSGTIETETLEQALQAMQFSTPFRYRVQGNEVWISQ